LIKVFAAYTVVPLACDGVNITFHGGGRLGGVDWEHGAFILSVEGNPQDTVLNGVKLSLAAAGTEILVSVMEARSALTKAGV
jgi:hypothetical protein